MKHIKYADKTLLVGDDAADTIVEYATALAQSDAADNVNLDGYGPDGQDTTASFVLNAGTVLMAETTHSSISERDNHEVIAYMKDRIPQLRTPAEVRPEDHGSIGDYDFAEATAEDFTDPQDHV